LSDPEFSIIKRAIETALSAEVVDQLGRDTGQCQRARVVTPLRLAVALITALGVAKVESIADLNRQFNHQNRTRTRYKAFWCRLARASFPKFMRRVCGRLLSAFALRTLEPQPGSALSQFEDILIQDGSSFAIRDALAKYWPGRFTKVGPAAVELHVTYSGLQDEVVAVTLTADKESERPYLPAPEELRGKLLLGDRGLGSVRYFRDVRQAGGDFVMRLSRSYNPYVQACYVDGRYVELPEGMRLAEFIAQHPHCAADLDVGFRRGKRLHQFRVTVLPNRERHPTLLCTTLDRQRFPAELVGQLYRFRWQIELCFKEWKSYANLHRFNTGNEHIAEGLIWASLCAALTKRFLAHAAQLVGHVPISTRRVAMCARFVLETLALAILHRPRRLGALLSEALQFLIGNACRAHPDRDRRKGRLRAGLALVGVA